MARSCSALIRLLLLPGCPADVSRFVVPVVFDPVKRELRVRLRSDLAFDVLYEVSYITPALADSNPPGAVVWVAGLFLVEATVHHAAPRAVQRVRVRQPVRGLVPRVRSSRSRFGNGACRLTAQSFPPLRRRHPRACEFRCQTAARLTAACSKVPRTRGVHRPAVTQHLISAAGFLVAESDFFHHDTSSEAGSRDEDVPGSVTHLLSIARLGGDDLRLGSSEKLTSSSTRPPTGSGRRRRPWSRRACRRLRARCRSPPSWTLRPSPRSSRS